MQGIDLKGQLNKYLFDNKRKIPKAHLQSVCKIKQGEKTCRYICLCLRGYICVKKTPMKSTIDEMNDKMSSKGDNCEGLG